MCVYVLGSYKHNVDNLPCAITSVNNLLNAECELHNDMVINYQVTARLAEASEVQKLHSNQSMDLHTPVTLQVERDGLYQVTILAIVENSGLLDSTVVYSQRVMVDSMSSTESTPGN